MPSSPHLVVTSAAVERSVKRRRDGGAKGWVNTLARWWREEVILKTLKVPKVCHPYPSTTLLVVCVILNPTPTTEGVAEEVFDLGVEAAQLVLGPPVELVHQVRWQAEQEWLALSHQTTRPPGLSPKESAIRGSVSFM